MTSSILRPTRAVRPPGRVRATVDVEFLFVFGKTAALGRQAQGLHDVAAHDLGPILFAHFGNLVLPGER